MDEDILEIGDHEIKRGETTRLDLPVSSLYTGAEIAVPVFVKRGKKSGPTFFISAAIHGDELNGIEIVGRVMNSKLLDRMAGTFIAVPMVNVYGVLHQTRYLPDRRDLNRSFPGSRSGSVAARLAHVFLNEIVAKCDYGIDLHTGAIHRSNLPQIRGDLKDPETLELARSFGAPVLLQADLRDGSLRQNAAEHGVKTLLYEAGEALRFDEVCIRIGYRGVINVMRHLGMLREVKRKAPIKSRAPYIAQQSGWVRASESGFVNHKRQLGHFVKRNEVLAIISDPYGIEVGRVVSAVDGIIIGKQNIPLVQEGEAMYHIAYLGNFSNRDITSESRHIQIKTEDLSDEWVAQ
jgi:predicted deacylase